MVGCQIPQIAQNTTLVEDLWRLGEMSCAGRLPRPFPHRNRNKVERDFRDNLLEGEGAQALGTSPAGEGHMAGTVSISPKGSLPSTKAALTVKALREKKTY